MKRTTKGALAVGAAAVLLAGGGGTLAYWNATGTVPGGQFQAGSLTLDASNCTSATWTVTNTIENVTAQPFNPATQRIVPGDRLTKTCTVTVNAVGTNLRANLAVTAPSVGTTAPVMPSSQYSVDGTFTLGGQPLTQITSANNGQTINASIVVNFPIGSTVNNVSQNGVIDLQAFTVTATQVTA